MPTEKRPIVPDVQAPSLLDNGYLDQEKLESCMKDKNLEIKYCILTEHAQRLFRTVIVGRKNIVNQEVENARDGVAKNNTSDKTGSSKNDDKSPIYTDWKIIGVGSDSSKHVSIKMAIKLACLTISKMHLELPGTILKNGLVPCFSSSSVIGSNNGVLEAQSTPTIGQYVEMKKLIQKFSLTKLKDMMDNYEVDARHLEIRAGHFEYEMDSFKRNNHLSFIREKSAFEYRPEEDSDELDLDDDLLVHKNSLDQVPIEFVEWIAHILGFADQGSCGAAITSYSKVPYGVLMPILLLQHRILVHPTAIPERILVIKDFPSSLKYHDNFLQQFISTKLGRSNLKVMRLDPYRMELEKLNDVDICYISTQSVIYLTHIYGFEFLDLFKYFVCIEGIYNTRFIKSFIAIMENYSRERYDITKPFVFQCGFTLSEEETPKKVIFCGSDIPRFVLHQESLKERLKKHVFNHEDYKSLTKIKPGLLIETLNKDHKLDILTCLLRDFHQREYSHQESILILTNSDEEVYALEDWLTHYRRRISGNDSFLISIVSKTRCSANITEPGFHMIIMNKCMMDSIMLDRISYVLFVGNLVTKNESSATMLDVNSMKAMFPMTEIYLMQSQRERTTNSSIQSPFIDTIQKMDHWFFTKEYLNRSDEKMNRLFGNISITHQQLLDEIQLPFVCTEILLCGYIFRMMDTSLTLAALIYLVSNEDIQNSFMGWQDRFPARMQIPRDRLSIMQTLENFEKSWKPFRSQLMRRRYVRRFSRFDDLERSVSSTPMDKPLTFSQLCLMAVIEDMRCVLADHLKKTEFFSFADSSNWSPWEDFGLSEYNTGNFGGGKRNPKRNFKIMVGVIFDHVLGDQTVEMMMVKPGDSKRQPLVDQREDIPLFKRLVMSSHPLILQTPNSTHNISTGMKQKLSEGTIDKNLMIEGDETTSDEKTKNDPIMEIIMQNTSLSAQTLCIGYRKIYYHVVEAKLYRLCHTSRLDYAFKRSIRANSGLLDSIWELMI